MAHRLDSARRSTRWAVALCCWVLFVWGHSLVQGPQSSLESGAVVALLRPAFELVGLTDASLMTLLVRKAAHFLEYAVLGALACGLFSSLRAERGVRPLPWALLVALVPVLDECLQLAVPGRSGRATDVLIDLTGIACGALALAACRRLRARLAARRGASRPAGSDPRPRS